MKPSKILYLIDGTAYIHRAYHAVRELSNSKGMPTNAVFGFTRMLLKLLKEKKAQYLAVVFDSKGPTFRHKMYEQYKANRPPMPEDMAVQIPYIKDITQGFSIPVIEQPGFEADDLMGTIASHAEKAGFSVVLVTGDKDLLQLATDRVSLWDPMKEKATDIAAIRNEFGLDPSQLIDVMGLSGDSSDNVPGVPGVGPKTALDLIRTFGSMKTLYEQIDKITKKKLKENLIDFK
ncbi:MAG: DNA polymerase I, partial [Desulfobacteraceae bacterium]|nr:DNA polymerase I [Desulfobacteraceae bacterium]